MENTLRTRETQEHYEKVMRERASSPQAACPLCFVESVREFTFWRIVPNAFPYDRIARVHHMAVPKRHAQWADLTADELDEFDRLRKNELDGAYTYFVEASTSFKSIPAHFHMHLITLKTFVD